MSQFEREERYIVVKIRDAQAIDSDEPFNGYDHLRSFLKQQGIPTRESLVIEKDWPEYEPTWAAIERRVTGTVQWDGQGLPPVGADVECKFAVEDKRIWHRGTVVYRGVQPEGDDFIVVKTDKASACYREGGGMVRPYRTPEQIAAEERNLAISEMMGFLGEDGEALAETFARMYDAGYRKQVAP